MAKLIHSVSIAGIKNSTLLWASNAYTDLAKAALIFTDDGHIVVKGTDYKVALAITLKVLELLSVDYGQSLVL